jgi:hypothetical protein
MLVVLFVTNPLRESKMTQTMLTRSFLWLLGGLALLTRPTPDDAFQTPFFFQRDLG